MARRPVRLKRVKAGFSFPQIPTVVKELSPTDAVHPRRALAKISRKMIRTAGMASNAAVRDPVSAAAVGSDGACEQLVGHRIEELAKGRDDLPAAGEVAINPIGYRGCSKDAETCHRTVLPGNRTKQPRAQQQRSGGLSTHLAAAAAKPHMSLLT